MYICVNFTVNSPYYRVSLLLRGCNQGLQGVVHHYMCTVATLVLHAMV